MKIKISFYVAISCLCLILSCSSSSGNQLKEHRIETFVVDPGMETKSMSKAQYTIDSIRPLVFPDSIKGIGISKIYDTNDRIYILDSEITKYLYVFDHNGHLKFRIGERGRLKGEFIGQPSAFFVDTQNKIHVLDELGRKIIIFNESGTVNKVIQLDRYYPLSFGLTRSNKYMMYCTSVNEEKVSTVSLSLFDDKMEINEELMSLECDVPFVTPILSFFQNGDRLSHIPSCSDSVIVFKNDTLEKVVSFDFKGGVLCKDYPDLFTATKDLSFLSDYAGVLGLQIYQENKSLMYMEYIHNHKSLCWLYDKKNNNVYQGRNIFEGVNPYTYCFLNDNQIVTYISPETIEALKEFQNNKEFQDNLEKSPEQIKDILTAKIKVPALVYITIR